MKNLITLIAAALIIFLGTCCMAQTKQDSTKSYPGYKFKLPCRAYASSLGRKTFFNLVDTAGIKGGNVYYKAWDERTGRYVTKLSERGLTISK